MNQTHTQNQPRAGQPWVAEEISILLQNIKSGKSFHEIALFHGRSIGAIQARLTLLAIDMFKFEGRSYVDIQRITGLPDRHLIQTLSRLV